MDSFSNKSEIKALREISGELTDIAGASGVLSWDQEVMMPPKGAGARAWQLSTLAGIYHQKLISDETKKAIEKAKGVAQGETDTGLVREMEREVEKATKLPTELVKKISEATSKAFNIWQKAKAENNFAAFGPILAEVLNLRIEAANIVKTTNQTVYDAMLDDYEPDLTEKRVDEAFEPIKPKLSELAKVMAEKSQGAEKVILGKVFPVEKQDELGEEILRDMGYDFAAGRIDKSAHPFTINFDAGDVRITTWRDDESDLRPALFASIHEGGHALYEQGVDKELARTHLAGGQGLVLHESQSRLWENIVGRSLNFWSYYLPKWQEKLTALKGVELKDFVKAINKVKPSLIRVEADEVTYGLHIILRFEIEKGLVSGKMTVKDLPEIWREKMVDLLGIKPETDTEGVLQDVHWSHGSFGYFPTYLLGTMTAAQIWEKIPTQLRDVQGPELVKLREWLKLNLHRFGRTYPAVDLVKKITGSELSSNYFIDYLNRKFTKLFVE